MKYALILLLVVAAFAADECALVYSDGKVVEPKAQDDDVNKLGVCKHYQEKSCCPTLDAGQVAGGIYSATFGVEAVTSGSCSTYRLLCMCYTCNPDLANADKKKDIENGICKETVDDIYDACKDTPGFIYKNAQDEDTFLASPEGGKVMSDHWSTAEKWWDENMLLGTKAYADLPKDKCWSAGSMVVPAVLALLAPLLALL
jgi:hypothetical protein